MPNIPDYSQYVAIKRIGAAQTANANASSLKGRVSSRFDGYFPMYRGIRLPANALISNKFIIPPAPIPRVLFTPSDITGLSLWLDAADDTTLTVSGTDITRWNDKSAIGNSYQATAGNYPTYSLDSTGYNKYGVYFDGVNDHMIPVNTALRSLNGSQWTTFFVIRLTGSTDNFMSVYRTTQSGLWIRYNVSGSQWSFYIINSEVNPSLSLVNSNGVFTDVISSSSHIVYQNGTQLGNTAGGNSTSYSETITLGGNGTGESMTGFMFEFIIYNGATLSNLNRQKVEGYLSWKWGLQSSLPTNHPYKGLAP